MPNDFSSVIPSILKPMAVALRENAVMARLVYGDFADVAGSKGQVITIDRPVPMAVQDVVPGTVTAQDVGAVVEQVALSNWKEVSWVMSDKELDEMLSTQKIQGQTLEAIRAVGNAIDLSLIQQMTKGAYGVVDVGSSVPVTDIVNCMTRLNTQAAPKEDRAFVVGATTFGALMANAQLTSYNTTNDQGAIRDAKFAGRYGFATIEYDSNIDGNAWTPGTVADLLVDTGTTYPAGTRTIHVDTVNGGTLKIGDVITFNGHTQTYVVTDTPDGTTPYTFAGTGEGDIGIYPGLKVAVANNVAITLDGAETQIDLAFQKMGGALVMRPPKAPVGALASYQTIVDPLTGLSFGLEIERQHKRTVWTIDALWGVGQVFRECIVRFHAS